MPERILFVDDEPNILAGFYRQLRRAFDVETALGAQEGLDAVSARGPYAVIVSDLRMPGMDGIRFLSKVREMAPDSVRMMLTGFADLQTAIEAVNEGNIFRFLTKPCESEVLKNALSAGVRQYQLVIAERELLEKTLRGSIKVLTEVLELVNPEAFGRASRIRRYTKQIARRLHAPHLWQVETAGALSQIGCVILPETALKKVYHGEELSGEESQLFSMHPFVASDLITHIPRMQGVAEIIAYQEKNFDGSGVPQDTRRGEEIPLGARILKVVLDFDTLQARGESKIEALRTLAARTGRYDPAILETLEAVVGIETRTEERAVSLNELTDDMVLVDDIRISDGRLLVARGYHINRTLRERLRNFAEKPGIKEPIWVRVPVQVVSAHTEARQTD